MNLQIATATEEQGVVAEQMSQSIDEISSMSTEIYTDSSQIADQTIALAQMSTRLKTLVDNFQTKECLD